MSSSWIEITTLLVGGGGGLTALFGYLRGSKSDASSQLMTVWNTLTKEQQDWRAMLMHRIQEQESKLTALNDEKNQLIIRIGELETHNRELMEDNEELRQKVSALTAELRKHTEKAVA